MTALRQTIRTGAARRRTPRAETARRATPRRPQRLPAAAVAPDWPARLVLAALFLAAVALLSLRLARGASAAFGLVPLWLAALPATAALALAAARRTDRAR